MCNKSTAYVFCTFKSCFVIYLLFNIIAYVYYGLQGGKVMADRVCPQCGAPIDPTASECKYCGEKLTVQQTSQPQQQAGPQQFYSQQNQQQTGPQQFYSQQNQQQAPQQFFSQQFQSQTVQQGYYAAGIDPSWPIRSKVTAGLIAIFLGGFGLHKFYLGKTSMGILYLCLCWTGLPMMIGFVEGLIYLCSSDLNFQLNNHVRLG